MKKYLVTRIFEEDHIEELPPGARVLTREEVEQVLSKQAWYDFNGKQALDELFGDQP